MLFGIWPITTVLIFLGGAVAVVGVSLIGRAVLKRHRRKRLEGRTWRLTKRVAKANDKRVRNKPVKHAAKRAKWITIASGFVTFLQAVDQGKRNQREVLKAGLGGSYTSPTDPPSEAKPTPPKGPKPGPAPYRRPLSVTLDQVQNDTTPAAQAKARSEGLCSHYLAREKRLCHNKRMIGRDNCGLDGHDQQTPVPGAAPTPSRAAETPRPRTVTVKLDEPTPGRDCSACDSKGTVRQTAKAGDSPINGADRFRCDTCGDQTQEAPKQSADQSDLSWYWLITYNQQTGRIDAEPHMGRKYLDTEAHRKNATDHLEAKVVAASDLDEATRSAFVRAYRKHTWLQREGALLGHRAMGYQGAVDHHGNRTTEEEFVDRYHANKLREMGYTGPLMPDGGVPAMCYAETPKASRPFCHNPAGPDGYCLLVPAHKGRRKLYPGGRKA